MKGNEYGMEKVTFVDPETKEEIQFYIFLRDIKNLGLILDFEYQPSSFCQNW